jgi:serine/threonine-protein kinase
VRKAKAQTENTVDTILQAGQIVDGKYRVDRLLGQGGMAAVWAGINERTGKRVALKVILQSLATTPEAQQLLHREALAASRVNHPNVVTVFDVIEHEGMTCIVMELLDGEPLGAFIARQGYLSVGEATSVLLPAMRGVAAANAQGVIHRDLKPQNIFICIGPDGRIVTTKVLDFGISVMVERVLDPTAGPVSGVTLGTPSYMSPEHIAGAANIDQRADVYGFGVLLYEALTGQMPLPGEQGPALFERILNEPAPSVALFRPDLPPGLVHIIERAMAKRPEQRYSGLNAMASAIEDELAPATPPPRLLTPIVGVPLLVPRDQSGPYPGPVVQAIINQEQSGQHQETKILFGFPLEKEGKESAPDQETKLLFGFPVEKENNDSAANGEADGGDGGSTAGPQEEDTTDAEADAGLSSDSNQEGGDAVAGSNGGSTEEVTPPLTGRNTVRLRLQRFSADLYRPERLSPLRGWRGAVTAGAAGLVVLVVWMAMRDARPVRKPAPLAAPAPAAVAPAPAPVVPTPAVVAPAPAEMVPAPAAVAPAPAAVAPVPAAVAPAPLPVANPTLPASESAALPAGPAAVPTTTVPSAADPEVAPPSSPAPSTLATVKSSKSTSQARAMAVPAIRHRSPVALREPAKALATPQAAVSAKTAPPLPTPRAAVSAKPAPLSPAPKAAVSTKPAPWSPGPKGAASAKPAPPRAGSLSADDF